MKLLGEIRILQLGEEDWNKRFILPKNVSLDFVDKFLIPFPQTYDLVFLDRTPFEDEIRLLHRVTKAYTLFITENVDIDDKTEWLCKCKKFQYISIKDVQNFLINEARFYYEKPYGEKFSLRDIAISQGFCGIIKWNGNHDVTLQGEFGDDFYQIASWRYGSPVARGEVIDLWLEYSKGPDVNISLVVTQFAYGSIDKITNQWEFDEIRLKQVIQIEIDRSDGSVFASIKARGNGTLQIIALHKRKSRGSHGYFLPGGERYEASNREEIFCYFDPGDLKPPLNIYFSGYKILQGFEGYNLMRSMGCPFLLLSESRLEGGCLYVGTKEYERLIVMIIRKYMDELGFTSKQVILSGISGGTYGALYYGADIRPHAMILGKPVPSLGNVAANEKYLRPGGLPTTLDMLRYLSGDTDTVSVEKLNGKFWDKFDTVDWGGSKFIVAYMIEDDYDPDAYNMLLSHLWSSGVQVYGKGIHGRHNDNTPAIVNWFSSQYKKVLNEDFLRKVK